MGDDVAIALTSGRAIPAAFFPVRDAGEPRPGVLVLHELLGLTAEMRWLARYEGVSAWLGRRLPMHVGHDPEAAEDAWRRTIAFFTRHLAPVPQ